MEMVNSSQILSSVETLQSRIKGSVLIPGDADYAKASQPWNLSHSQHPAVVVMAKNAKDVAEAIHFADDNDFGVAILATGHGVSLAADNAVLINTSPMQAVRIDPVTKSAWVEAGVKWGSVLEKAQVFGLAPLLGSTTDVGVVGYTLGGGMGWLARKYGLSADSVNFFEMVTADGRILHVSQSENSDLFWALCGGGGSFGVITGMEIKLYAVDTVYAGNLLYPAQIAKEVFVHYKEWIANAPDELTSSISIMNFPPVPAVPEFLRGKSFAIVRGCYSGTIEKGEELLKWWREWQAPVIDDFKAIPFTMADVISNDPVDPVPDHSSAVWLREINEDVFDLMIKYTTMPSALTIVEVRHAGGAIARVKPGTNAYGNRDANHILHMLAFVPGPEAMQAARTTVTAFKHDLQPYTTGGVYINFLVGEEKWEQTKRAFSAETYQRLQVLKAKYDGKNRFRYSFNIPVAAKEGSSSVLDSINKLSEN
ncbi:MAG: FAD-binding protein [Anaerolineaceae bacterium]|nr:FAD-binding protein [Anaerolineaceae bacterium]